MTTANDMLKNNIFRIALGTVLLLLIPLVAMQFSEDVNWKLNDFVVAGVLLFGTGLLLHFVLSGARSGKRRLALGLVVIAAFLYIWAELAVGIFANWGS